MKSIPLYLALLLTACQSKDITLQTVSLRTMEQEKVNGSELFEGHISAITFLMPECPLSENYCLTLNDMQMKYEQEGVDFIGVVAGDMFSMYEIDAFIDEYGLRIPVYLDKKKELVTLLEATITPEVFLLDTAMHVMYSGAIDNWAVDLGRKREVITKFYLRDAVDALLEGRHIETSKTEAVGCFIE